MKAWDVYVERGGKRLCVDTVFYVDSASADEIRRGLIEHESLEVARIMLGHQSIATTLIYAKVHDRRAILAALRRG